ncbi:hypothetical protein EA462_00530 [Natrarchaeobius halalkaliphilus]|uniref:Uncharacterized protein n=1 Tax=Natrarchaeobius halalkaliphilus TaxID=1679091 RepID=A0A3N6N3P1_9EURY|nr:hypothetical protein [Natrarchaeobius halalkaliphilus]RQG92752.1 hypothetical protein EA462_00530 [Natrarchaeobius halalkaliphilus]
MFIEPDRLESRLREEFGGGSSESRVVVRQAVDLADSCLYVDDVGSPLTNDVVIEELSDAREGTPAARWNWWIGSLDVAFGHYHQFSVRRYPYDR